MLCEGRRQPSGSLAQLTVGEVAGRQIRLDDGERNGVGGVVVTQEPRWTRVVSAEPVDELFDANSRLGHRILPRAA